jgi:hypothetical protein
MANIYTEFVKNNYQSIKQANPEANSKDVLRLIATEWNATKPPKPPKAPKTPRPKIVKQAKVPKEPKAKTKKVKSPPIINEGDIEGGIANIEDALQTAAPSVEIAKKVLKPSPKIATKKRKTTIPENDTAI